MIAGLKMADQTSAWRCSVCGYVHHGPGPPDVCPVCGVSRDQFEPYTEPAKPAGKPAVRQWRCVVCDYLHEGPEPPEVCPVCGALADSFEPVAEAAEKTAETGRPAKVVIVGAGIAGIAAAESIREASSAAEITLVSRESDLPYYRLNLTRYLAGEISARDLPIHPENWYPEQNVRLLRGTEVSAIHLEEQTAELRDGEKLPYEKLLLAAGAHPFVPPIPGTDREGVTAVRTVQDANRILESVQGGASVVCIGGGILGLETAGALARRGADVTLLESHGWLLPRQLNRRAAEILAEHVAASGIKLRRNARTRQILGDDHARGVLLEDGTQISADLVVITTGIRSNSYLARIAGLEVNQGVLVNDRLNTSDANVSAAGDVAEHRGVVYGIWGPSQYQGNIAGLNIAGVRTQFGGVPRSNTLKVLGVDLFSIGRFVPEDASFETMDQQTDGQYFHFLFRDNRLVGAILLGGTTLTARVKKAVETREDFSGVLRKRPGARELMDFLGAYDGP